jgi:hypothetical protein
MAPKKALPGSCPNGHKSGPLNGDIQILMILIPVKQRWIASSKQDMGSIRQHCKASPVQVADMKD